MWWFPEPERKERLLFNGYKFQFYKMKSSGNYVNKNVNVFDTAELYT